LDSRIKKIFDFLQIKFPNSNSSYINYSRKFKEILKRSLSEITDINDIYEFFNSKIRELKQKNENALENKFSTIEQGGYIDLYIRKCMVAFYKMNFEDITKLFEKIKAYERGDEINITLTLRESQYLFEKQINEFFFFSNNQHEKKLNEKLLNFYNYRQKFYFSEQLSNLNEEDQIFCENNFEEFKLQNKEDMLSGTINHGGNKNFIFSYLDPKAENYGFEIKEKNYSNLINRIKSFFVKFSYKSLI